MPEICTPAANLAAYKCLACLSVDELLKFWVIVLADVDGSGYTLPDDLPQLMEDASCWACLSDKQLLQATVSANAQDVEGESTVQAIRDKAKCLLCANPKQIKAILAMLICRAGLQIAR
jgi:hypothetical protein